MHRTNRILGVLKNGWTTGLNSSKFGISQWHNIQMIPSKKQNKVPKRLMLGETIFHTTMKNLSGETELAKNDQKILTCGRF